MIRAAAALTHGAVLLLLGGSPALAVLAAAWTWFEAGPTERSTPTSSVSPLPTAIGVALLATLLTAAAVGTPGRFAPVGGVAMALGIALRRLAIAHLGRWFLDDIELRPDHALVTDGPYAWVRHPSELGTGLIALGAALLGGSVAATLLAGLVLAPLIVMRMRREDALLREHFGDAWRDWAATVRSS